MFELEAFMSVPVLTFFNTKVAWGRPPGLSPFVDVYRLGHRVLE